MSYQERTRKLGMIGNTREGLKRDRAEARRRQNYHDRTQSRTALIAWFRNLFLFTTFIGGATLGYSVYSNRGESNDVNAGSSATLWLDNISDLWENILDINIFANEEKLNYEINFERIEWPGTAHIPARAFTNQEWPSVVRWRDLAVTMGKRYELDPKLLLSVWWVESNGLHGRADGEEVISRCGAVGLGQVMPSDDPYNRMPDCGVDLTIFRNRPTTTQLNDPAVNAEASAAVLRGSYEYALEQALKNKEMTSDQLNQAVLITRALRGYGPRGVEDDYANMVLFVFDNIKSVR